MGFSVASSILCQTNKESLLFVSKGNLNSGPYCS
jgi:hypothetical protein